MPIKEADKWITMTFRNVVNGENQDAIVMLNAHRIGSSFEDLTETVAQILATAIDTQTPFTIISAQIHSENIQNLNFL